jgi:hypothetical protein
MAENPCFLHIKTFFFTSNSAKKSTSNSISLLIWSELPNLRNFAPSLEGVHSIPKSCELVQKYNTELPLGGVCCVGPTSWLGVGISDNSAFFQVIHVLTPQNGKIWIIQFDVF